MKAVILAAGRGVRFYPVTEDTPKCLVPLHGRPILCRQIEALLENGIQEIIVVAGYKSHLVEQLVLSREEWPVKIVLNTEFMNTNNMYSLFLTREQVMGESFFLLNGDVVYEKTLWQKLLRFDQFPLCPYDSGQDDDESLKLKLDQEKVPQAILPKKTERGDHHGCVAGSFGFSNKASTLLFEDMASVLAQEKRNEWFEYSLSRIFPNIPFTPLDIAGFNWIEIDNVQDYQKAQHLFT